MYLELLYTLLNTPPLLNIIDVKQATIGNTKMLPSQTR